MRERLRKLLPLAEENAVRYRRDFHAHPELGWGEYRTASLIARRLQELGYRVKTGQAVLDGKSRMGLPEADPMRRQYDRAIREGADREYAETMREGFTGVTGELGQGTGATIGFRFDIDAVPVRETLDPDHFPARENFTSRHDEAMHACGHDGHAAIGLGLAEIIAGLDARLPGRVKLIFQPAEEGVRGARAMVEAGVVDDVDILFGLHIGLGARKTGEFRCGTRGFLATTKFDAHFTGVPAHPAYDPHKGRNALLSAATAVMNLQAIPPHGAGRTWVHVGSLTTGAGRNLIPDRAVLVMETRGETSALDDYARTYAERIIATSAETHGTRCSIVRMGEAASGDSDEGLMRRVHEIARRSGVFPDLKLSNEGSIGVSEDFTHMMKRVADRGGRSTYLLLGSDLVGNHHSPQFDFDESVLGRGVEILALLALELGGESHEV